MEQPIIPKKFFGSLPRYDVKYSGSDMIRNTEGKWPGVNYTDDEELWNCFPFLSVWDGKLVNGFKLTADIAQQLVQSFNDGTLQGKPRTEDGEVFVEPLAIDLWHGAYIPGSPQKSIAFAVQAFAKQVQVYTTNDAGKKVFRDYPNGTWHFFLKCLILKSGEEILKQQELPYPSVVFTQSESGALTGTPTFCVAPADKYSVPLVMFADSSIQTMKTESEDKNMDSTKMVMTGMSFDKKTKKFADSSSPLYQTSIDAFGSIMSVEDATALANAVSEGGLQVLLDLLKNQMTQKTDSSTADQSATLSQILEKFATDIKNIIAPLQKLTVSPQTPPLDIKKESEGSDKSGDGTPKNDTLKLTKTQKAVKMVLLSQGLTKEQIDTELQMYADYGDTEEEETKAVSTATNRIVLLTERLNLPKQGFQVDTGAKFSLKNIKSDQFLTD